MPTKLISRALLFSLLVLSAAAETVPAPKIVSLTASDGLVLKASYFAAAQPGPGVILLHQCNQERKLWDPLAQRLASSGINVLTLDYRGFGESGGTRFEKMTPEARQKMVTETWPVDIDLAFQYLESQPGVNRSTMGAGGASCGVDNSIKLARRHPEVKSLVLLAGPSDRAGRLFLRSSNLPVFAGVADDDEFPGMVEAMQWLLSVSSNPADRFARYANGGHAAEIFAVHKDFPAVIAQWFVATLLNQPASLPKTDGARFDPQVVHILDLLDQPGGATEAAKELTGPNPMFPPETIVNLIGYEHIQINDNKGAVEIMKLNAQAHPNSANAYDSLSDAYLADGEKDLALSNARKALDLLAEDTSDNEQRRNAIRDSAEQKVKQLDPSGQAH